jgi:ketosteroid isomerase-like protein
LSFAVTGAQDNIELVKSAFDAWNRGDVDGFVDHAAEDLAWHEVSGRPEAHGTEHLGRESIRRSLKSLFDAWESYRLEAERIEEVDDRILAVVREVARGRTSGVKVEGRWGYLITVEDGQIVRVEAHRDADQALRAAGLSDARTPA